MWIAKLSDLVALLDPVFRFKVTYHYDVYYWTISVKFVLFDADCFTRPCCERALAVAYGALESLRIHSFLIYKGWSTASSARLSATYDSHIDRCDLLNDFSVAGTSVDHLSERHLIIRCNV